jgi:hypothetical protein
MVTTVGPIRDVISAYLRCGADHMTARAEFPVDASMPCQFLAADVLHVDGSPRSRFSTGEPFVVRLQFEIRKPLSRFFLEMALTNLEGIRVVHSDIRDSDVWICDRLGVGRHTFSITIPARLLAPTGYTVTISAKSPYAGFLDRRFSCCEFSIHELDDQRRDRSGVLSVLLPWEHQYQAGRPIEASP